MHTPDYQDYSLAQLEDCLQHINRQKYPERFRLITDEIALRRELGENAVDPAVNELTGADIPFRVALQLWLCYTWRLGLGCLGVILLLALMRQINTMTGLLPAGHFFLIQLLAGLLIFLIAGPLIMMQVLARPFSGFRIRIITRSAPHFTEPGNKPSTGSAP